MWLLALVLWCGIAFATASRADAEDTEAAAKLALYSKPSVVRIYGAAIGKFRFHGKDYPEAIGGTGSGFFLSSDGYIATNAHVVDVVQKGEKAAVEALVNDFIKDVVRDVEKTVPDQIPPEVRATILKQTEPLGSKMLNFVVMPNGEHASYDIKEFGSVTGEGQGKDCAVIKISTRNAPTLSLGDSTRVQVQDHVTVIGFPGAADDDELFAEAAALDPSVTDGSIARSVSSSSGEQILQVTAATTHGNSGGPAINQNGEVIGLLTFGSDKVQGFNFLVASNTLAEFVRKAGVGESTSATNVAWRTAVDLYFDRRYTAAIQQLEEVQSLFPAHSDAKDLMMRAHELKRAGKERMPVELYAGGGAAAVAALGFSFVLARKRKRRPLVGGEVSLPPTRRESSAAGSLSGRSQTAPPEAAVSATVFAAGRHGTLTATRGHLRGQRFTLTGDGLLIGRQPGVAHIIVDDGRASGQHCWVRWEGERLFAIDQSTTNGTFVNDPNRGRISRAELKNGDVLIIADPECCSLAVTIS